MAVRLLDATALIERTTNLVQGNSDRCVCFWCAIEPVVTGSDYVTLWEIDDGAAHYEGIFGYFSGVTNENEYLINADNGSGAAASPSLNRESNQNFHIGYRKSGTSLFWYINGYQVGSTTEDMSAITYTVMRIGNDGFSEVAPSIKIWDFFEWSTSKSGLFIQDQMASYGVAISATALVTATPLLSDLLDDSGNGNDWIGTGNFTFVANPTLPLNITPAAATIISSLPFSETIVETYNLPMWYVRTALPGETYIGGYGFGGLGSYEPVALVWSGDGTQEWPIDSAWQTVSINAPFQTPLVAGEPIYFEFRSQWDGSGGQLDVSFVPEPTEEIPVGAILVTNEWPGYGTAVIDPTDGHVLQFRYSDFPSSEEGAALPDGNGRILVVGADSFYDSANLFLYEADLTLILTIPFESASPSEQVSVATSNRTDTFYLAYERAGLLLDYVRRMNANGTIDPTIIGPLPGTTFTAFNSIAVSPDETILYYRVDGNNLGAIRRWDLVNNMAMSDLVSSPGLGWFGMGTLLVMPDGDVIGGFSQFILGTNENIARYEPDGTLVWAWDSSDYQFDYHGVKTIAGPGWPDEIMVIGSVNGGHTAYVTLDAATGVELSSFMVPQFELGAYAPGESSSPEARFGPSPSCFHYITSVAIVEGQGIIGPLIWVEWPRRVIQ